MIHNLFCIEMNPFIHILTCSLPTTRHLVVDTLPQCAGYENTLRSSLLLHSVFY